MYFYRQADSANERKAELPYASEVSCEGRFRRTCLFALSPSYHVCSD